MGLEAPAGTKTPLALGKVPGIKSRVVSVSPAQQVPGALA